MTLAAHGNIQPPSARVLLLGREWQDMNGALAAAADTGSIVLLGPEIEYHAAQGYEGGVPTVLLLSPDAEGDFPNRDQEAPPVLRCVSSEDLDAPDLYRDSDDFVTVPCAPTELIKRILRLAQRHADAASLAESLRVGTITLNPVTYQVASNGRPVDLAWLEFQLLQFLMGNVGKVFTRDQLLANVWGVENIGGTRTVDVHIRRLRYKLETGGVTYFRTVKNVGYGMMQP
jgi:hypothetical protein